ncbi:hypothetical protein ACIRSU_34575 [Streptomyces sp. NPDC101160]|uniref:hypothetical protein n=1 Tax=Streptomyces sp. NPDC101160 TaxID=3366118 RepID=UPI00382B0399
MRPRNALALAATTAAATTAVALLVAPADQAQAAAVAVAPACGAVNAPDFPLATRIHGGPDAYPAGGAFRTWNLDLTNTTAQACRDIHPVLVLTDRDRALLPTQIRAEFYDAEARVWRPVAFESTDQAESVGVFDASRTGLDGTPAFPGFEVPAGRTLTVPVRLSFSADAEPDEVVVNAAVVQKRGDDGDWVGESGDYRLTIGPADPHDETFPTVPSADPTPTPTSAPTPTRAPVPSSSAGPASPADPGTGKGTGITPGLTGLPGLPELAHTGRQHALRLAPFSAALLATGAGLMLLARRRRTRGSRSVHPPVH